MFKLSNFLTYTHFERNLRESQILYEFYANLSLKAKRNKKKLGVNQKPFLILKLTQALMHYASSHSQEHLESSDNMVLSNSH